MSHRDGDPLFDCYAVLDVLYHGHSGVTSDPTHETAWWQLLWDDLQQKSRGLAERERGFVLRAALESRLPREFRPASWRHYIERESDGRGPRRFADVIICCVLEEEFNSTLIAFGVDQTMTKDTAFVFGHRLVLASIDTDYCGRINVWIGLIGESRSIACGNFCRSLLEYFEVRHCVVLVGVAAGREDEVKLGDVVLGTMVLDIEGARVEPSVTKPRFWPYPLPDPWRKLVQSFNADRWEWAKDRSAGIAMLKQTHSALPPPKFLEGVPVVKKGIIVSGEKLRRDDPLPELAHRHDDRIFALEMEGSGFAAACDAKKVKWVVVRGISDHGDMRKAKLWQPLAALHGGLVARAFLTHGLRSSSDPGLREMT